MRAAAALMVVLGLAACGEIPQDAKPYAGDAFKGDKAKYEAALAKRANFQNEYSRASWVEKK